MRRQSHPDGSRSPMSLRHILLRGLREPLLHFALLGAAIFLVHGQRIGNEASAPDEIVVSAGRQQSLSATFARVWQRAPTPTELKGLIDAHVREEVYAREAQAMRLDQDDAIIRRRLQQKMEFLTEDIATLTDPDDATLRAYLKSHPEKFAAEPTFSFTHIYLDPDRHGERLTQDVERLLTRLRSAGRMPEPVALGDPFLLPSRFVGTPSGEIEKQFGTAFAARLAELTPGQWQGPIESGYGVHLVRLGERTEKRLPELEEVREAVRNEWSSARREAANEAFYQELRKRYRVTVEDPQAGQVAAR